MGGIFPYQFFCLECDTLMGDWACDCLTFLRKKEICINMNYVGSRVSALKNNSSKQDTSVPSSQSSKINSIVMNASTSLTNNRDGSCLSRDIMNNSISLPNNRDEACLSEYCMDRARLFIEIK